MTLKRAVGPIIGVVLLAAALWVLRHELGEHSVREVIQDVRALSPTRLALCVLATLFSYLALSAHDLLALKSLGRRIHSGKAMLGGFTGFAFANSLPFAVVAGGAVRARFYGGSRLSTGSTTTLVLFNTVTYVLGLLAAAGLAFTFEPEAIPALLRLPFHSTRPIGLFALGLLGVFLVWSARGGPALRIVSRVLRPTPLGTSLARLGVSLLDWIFSAAALFVLLPGARAFGFPGFLGAFMLGQLAALIGQLPGGIGIFEAIIAATVGRTLPVTKVLGALLAYRVIYFFLPLLAAALILAVRELQHRRTHVAKR